MATAAGLPAAVAFFFALPSEVGGRGGRGAALPSSDVSFLSFCGGAKVAGSAHIFRTLRAVSMTMDTARGNALFTVSQRGSCPYAYIIA